MDRALKGSERNLDLGNEVLAIAVNLPRRVCDTISTGRSKGGLKMD